MPDQPPPSTSSTEDVPMPDPIELPYFNLNRRFAGMTPLGPAFYVQESGAQVAPRPGLTHEEWTAAYQMPFTHDDSDPPDLEDDLAELAAHYRREFDGLGTMPHTATDSEDSWATPEQMAQLCETPEGPSYM